jgi:hypothetical protein
LQNIRVSLGNGSLFFAFDPFSLGGWWFFILRLIDQRCFQRLETTVGQGLTRSLDLWLDWPERAFVVEFTPELPPPVLAYATISRSITVRHL